MGGFGCAQQRAVFAKWAAATIEHEAGEAHIVRAFGLQDGAAARVAQDRQAGHAMDMRAGLEHEPVGGIGSGGQVKRSAGACGCVGCLLQRRGLADHTVRGRDAIGAEGFRHLGIAGLRQTRARCRGQPGTESGEHHFAAPEGHCRTSLISVARFTSRGRGACVAASSTKVTVSCAASSRASWLRGPS